jgi:hypothetical protein
MSRRGFQIRCGVQMHLVGSRLAGNLLTPKNLVSCRSVAFKMETSGAM